MYSIKGSACASSTLPISYKAALAICRKINKMQFVKAKKFIEDLVAEKRAIKRKFYTKAAKEILSLLSSLESNAKSAGKELEGFKLFISANKGPTLYRLRRKRAFGHQLKMTNIQAVLVSK